jgi:hypothetical protein
MIFLRELDLLNGQRNVEDFTAGMLSRTSRINAVTTAGKPDPNVSRGISWGQGGYLRPGPAPFAAHRRSLFCLSLQITTVPSAVTASTATIFSHAQPQF